MTRDLGRAVVLIGVALAMSWIASADATSLTILPDPLVGSPGDTVLTSVVYTAEGALVSAIQFQVLFDPNAVSLTNQTAGSAAIAASKTLDFALISPGNASFVLFGLNQNVIGNGSVGDLTFQVSLNAPQGPYPLYLSEVLGADPNANPVSITNLNPPPAVPEPTTVSLLGIGLGALAAWRRINASGAAP